MSEEGVRGLCLVEPDLERWILAVGEPEVAARAEVHVEHDRVARGGGVREDSRLALLLGPALLGDRTKIRLQRELERFRGIEQPAARRPGRVGRRLLGDGLRLDPGRPGYDAHRRQDGQCDPRPPGPPAPPPPPPPRPPPDRPPAKLPG